MSHREASKVLFALFSTLQLSRVTEGFLDRSALNLDDFCRRISRARLQRRPPASAHKMSETQPLYCYSCLRSTTEPPEFSDDGSRICPECSSEFVEVTSAPPDTPRTPANQWVQVSRQLQASEMSQAGHWFCQFRHPASLRSMTARYSSGSHSIAACCVHTVRQSSRRPLLMLWCNSCLLAVQVCLLFLALPALACSAMVLHHLLSKKNTSRPEDAC